MVKVPFTKDGVRACKTLASEGTRVNVTLIFSATQAWLAAKAGASYVSPFVGRLDDIGATGMNLIREIVDIFDNFDYTTEVLVASARSPIHVVEAARMGADVVTVPAAVIEQCFKHPLTDIASKSSSRIGKRRRPQRSELSRDRVSRPEKYPLGPIPAPPEGHVQ